MASSVSRWFIPVFLVEVVKLFPVEVAQTIRAFGLGFDIYSITSVGNISSTVPVIRALRPTRGRCNSA